MAVVYYGAGVGAQKGSDVTIDSSTTSSAVELAVNDASIARGSINGTKQILAAIEAIRLAVLGQDY